MSLLNKENVPITKQPSLLLDQLVDDDINEANIIASIKAHVSFVKEKKPSLLFLLLIEWR